MAFIRLPFSVRITVEFLWNGKPVVNIHHARNAAATAPTVAEILNVCNAIYDSYSVEWLPFASNELSLTNVSGISLDQEFGVSAQTTRSVPLAGTIAGQSVSNQVALVVSYGGTPTGRSFRGRTYLAGIPEAETSQNGVTATVQQAAIDFGLSIDANLTAVGYSHIIASFFALGVPRTVAIGTSVNKWRVNDRVDTQRRRMPDSA